MEEEYHLLFSTPEYKVYSEYNVKELHKYCIKHGIISNKAPHYHKFLYLYLIVLNNINDKSANQLYQEFFNYLYQVFNDLYDEVPFAYILSLDDDICRSGIMEKYIYFLYINCKINLKEIVDIVVTGITTHPYVINYLISIIGINGLINMYENDESHTLDRIVAEIILNQI